MPSSQRRHFSHRGLSWIVGGWLALIAGACGSSSAPISGAGTGGRADGTGGATDGAGGNGTGTGGGIAATGGAGGGGAAGGVRACGAGDARGAFGFRVEVPVGVPVLGVAAFATMTKEIDGTVGAVTRVDEPCSSCGAGGSIPTVRIEVIDSGQKWVVVVLPGTATDAFEAAATTLPGMPVKVLIRLRREFQIMPSSAFMIRDANDNLVMAVEGGPFVRTLDGPDIAPLTVENGADVCQATICGNWVWAYTHLRFAFSGGSVADVNLGASANLTFGQRQYTAHNVSGGYLLPGTPQSCSDVERTRAWAIWSRPAGP